MNETRTKLICVASLKGAFGVKGEVRVKSFTEVPEDCLSFGPLLGQDEAVILTPASYRAVKDGFAVMSAEVTTPEQADALRGTKLYVRKSALPAPQEEEFYYSDLIGMQVKTVDGKNAGKIVSAADYGAGDLLEIKPKEGPSFFHPFTKDAVPKVDMKARRIIIKITEAENGKAPNGQEQAYEGPDETDS
jgi:16S rRNA processing protein RimM